MAGHAVTPVSGMCAVVVGGYRGGGTENKVRVICVASLAYRTHMTCVFQYFDGNLKMNPR